MKNTLLICLSLLCLASCKKKEDLKPAFAVLTKEPMNVGSANAYGRGSLITIDQVDIREAGFFWYSLTPPKNGGNAVITKSTLPYSQIYGDFSNAITYSSQPDSFNVHAYIITVQGDSMAGQGIKFINYVP